MRNTAKSPEALKSPLALAKSALAIVLGAWLVIAQAFPANAVAGELANTGGGPQWGIIAAGAVIILLGGGLLLWGARRRKK